MLGKGNIDKDITDIIFKSISIVGNIMYIYSQRKSNWIVADRQTYENIFNENITLPVLPTYGSLATYVCILNLNPPLEPHHPRCYRRPIVEWQVVGRFR